MQRRQDLEALATTLNGLAILGCLPGSPGANAGLRYGDILLEVNGHQTPCWASYIAASRLSGARMTLRIFRNGEELQHEFALDDKPRQSAFEILGRILDSGVLPDRSAREAADHLDALMHDKLVTS